MTAAGASLLVHDSAQMAVAEAGQTQQRWHARLQVFLGGHLL